MIFCTLENIRPLFAEDREDKKDGRPNAPIRILIAMSILKEGSGCSDDSLFENCCINMLYRRALGMVTLKEQCPSIEELEQLIREARLEEWSGQKGAILERSRTILKEIADRYKAAGGDSEDRHEMARFRNKILYDRLADKRSLTTQEPLYAEPHV